MIYQVGKQRVLLTEAIKKRVDENTSKDSKVYEYLTSLYQSNPQLFEEELAIFNLTGEEAKNATIELLNDYVGGSRGQLAIDNLHENIYWLDVWINGNLLTRKLKLSDYIRIKIDTEKVIQVNGKVEDFEVCFSNGLNLRCNECLTMIL